VEAKEYDKANWGLSREAIAEARKADAMFADFTHS
jgi:hypothetical protein